MGYATQILMLLLSFLLRCLLYINTHASIIIDRVAVQINQSINQYKFYSERNIAENIQIFLQLYMI